jgi:hypothetical protein
MTNFIPFSSNFSSSILDSSRAIPKEGPDQPIDITILITEFSSLSFRKSLIASDALSVTVNIIFIPFPGWMFHHQSLR